MNIITLLKPFYTKLMVDANYRLVKSLIDTTNIVSVITLQQLHALCLTYNIDIFHIKISDDFNIDLF